MLRARKEKAAGMLLKGNRGGGDSRGCTGGKEVVPLGWIVPVSFSLHNSQLVLHEETPNKPNVGRALLHASIHVSVVCSCLASNPEKIPM